MMHQVNWTAVLLAAAAAWMFGAIYYGILGKAWIAAQGKTMAMCKAENADKSSVAKATPFVLSFLAEVIMAWALYGILTHMGLFTLRAGAISGALIWLGFVLTTIAVNNAYSGRKTLLTVIDAGHWLGALIIIGAVVGYFGA
jgi:hypothetical protein